MVHRPESKNTENIMCPSVPDLKMPIDPGLAPDSSFTLPLIRKQPETDRATAVPSHGFAYLCLHPVTSQTHAHTDTKHTLVLHKQTPSIDKPCNLNMSDVIRLDQPALSFQRKAALIAFGRL